MRFKQCSLAILVLILTAFPAQATNWYPLGTGWSWTYFSSVGGSPSGSFQPEEIFAGALVRPLRWDSGVREYFSRDASGRKLLHGVTQPDGRYFVFDPPIVRIDTDLTVGYEWTTSTVAKFHDVGGEELWREVRQTSHRVLSIGTVEVAAGSFHAVEIDYVEGNFNFRDTYGQGVGWIRRTNAAGNVTIFELANYVQAQVATEDKSWGAIKSLFQD